MASGEGVSDPEPREAVLPGRRLEDEVLRWCVFILLVVLSEMIISKELRRGTESVKVLRVSIS